MGFLDPGGAKAIQEIRLSSNDRVIEISITQLAHIQLKTCQTEGILTYREEYCLTVSW